MNNKHIILACDPGRNTGWALFAMRSLIACGHVQGKAPRSNTTALATEILEGVDEAIHPHLPVGTDIDLVAVEEMFYHPHVTKSVPEDLLTVAHIAGALTSLGDSLRYVPAREWKGSTPKDICHRRMRGKLSEVETRAVDAMAQATNDGAQHNVLDAICIGLYVLNRFGV